MPTYMVHPEQRRKIDKIKRLIDEFHRLEDQYHSYRTTNNPTAKTLNKLFDNLNVDVKQFVDNCWWREKCGYCKLKGPLTKSGCDMPEHIGQHALPCPDYNDGVARYKMQIDDEENRRKEELAELEAKI